MPKAQPAQRASTNSGISLGRVFGVQVTLDWSLLLIFGLIALNLSVAVFPSWHPSWPPWRAGVAGTLAALLFLGSILLHELAHARVAQAFGMRVERITLFLFGGIAQVDDEPPTPKAEFWVAIVGPLTSLLMGMLATLGGWLFVPMPLPSRQTELFSQLAMVPTLLFWLGPINILLGLFNLVPGFPLDGGRVLRALLWWFTGDLPRATRYASRTGQAFAWLMIASGAAMIFGVAMPVVGAGVFQGIWLLLIGTFLRHAAVSSYRQLLLREALQNIRVEDLARPRTVTIAPHLPIDEVVRDYFLRFDQAAFPVVADEHLLGLVTLQDVRSLPRERWTGTRVTDIMTQSASLASVTPTTSAWEALVLLERAKLEQVPILSNDRIEGLLRRTDLTRWLHLQEGGLQEL